jgi:hypothetical protein
VPDRYMVCGTEYRSIRDHLVSEVRGQDGQLSACLQVIVFLTATFSRGWRVKLYIQCI